jgi:hypothetical protein
MPVPWAGHPAVVRRTKASTATATPKPIRTGAAGRRLGVGDHEEGEEDQAPHQELVAEHRRPLPEPEHPAQLEQDPAPQEVEAHVRAERPVHHRQP